MAEHTNKISVVIPCYKVTSHILKVIQSIGPEVDSVYIVDDCCPDNSGSFVEDNTRDPRVNVLRTETNQGVGGATMTGYLRAIADGMTVIVKLDGDGQMDPAYIPDIVSPILNHEADYVKGNRFFSVENVRTMPGIRIVGNAALSFISKLSTGYWDLFDSTNGYTAIHANVAECLPMEKISKRYFFESDLLFRLNTLRAVVIDIPMQAHYGNEVSNMKISKVFFEFLAKHTKNIFKRVFYNYYLRGMSLASIELPVGIASFSFGLIFGLYHWLRSASSGEVVSTGTAMLSALPILIGIQLILAFLAYDISNVPRRPISRNTLLKKNLSRSKHHPLP